MAPSEFAEPERVARWFQRLYGKARGYLHVAYTGNWAGRAFDLEHDGIEQAAEYVRIADAMVRPAGIYSRVTTLRQLPDKDRRGGGTLTATWPALWADVDIAGPGHKHVECAGGDLCGHPGQMHRHPVLPLPPTAEVAVSLIEDSPLPLPSLWVHSGGGMYPIWLLNPPVHPDSSAELDMLATLSSDWQRTIWVLARERGWHYGSGVGDPARVLRVPGTWNRKTDAPVPCQVVASNHLEYSIADLLEARNQIRLALPDIARPFAVPDQSVPRRPASERPVGDVRPGDDFTARVDWSDALLLGGLGWKCVTQRGTYREWLRQGAAGTLTATTGRGGGDNLWVFSTETVFPAQQAMSKLEAFRVIHGHPDFTSACRALSALNFGSAPAAPSSVPSPR